MNVLKLSAAALVASVAFTGAAVARDQIQIAGSSTVLPYASIVAEAFGENTDFPTPVVESGGSGAGRKKLCEGVGENTIDIANSSSRIKQSDIDTCAANGVKEIQEVRIGYDGIVFASDISGPEYAFTPADWHSALAAKIVKDGKLIDNPNKAWNEVRADLPAQPILAFIPGTKHGTREVFDEKVIVDGCKEDGTYEALLAENAGDKDKASKACMQIRTDGVSVDIDGDYTETLARVAANKNGIGVFGLSFYQNNTDKLRVGTMNGVVPSVESIASGEYPVSRPLYFYVKNAHLDVVPGLQEYVEFFVSDEMAGPDGPLAAYGLVSDPELAKTQAAVKARTPMGPLK
ncbi:MAG: substrate-binding domain-containing protein [Alphaproteobacteria bacterium]|nr:phosphonate ABC transporter substrate-binding protein [Rhizobiaceae bacterium]MBC7149139.1 substrate-binding domain-containing protein [Rhizobium sp.]MBU3964069.1 substrate-binding domain-containing protein [Alphaproteobacteria bacterium]MBU4048265.1 substrate-binding domain-containing protein [Alphaproteobacteria bacterium]MBU4089190.1 substrate-binding domain-containing protein [Alphaproteobacteria bacterium]